jgi:hypothetical protein
MNGVITKGSIRHKDIPFLVQRLVEALASEEPILIEVVGLGKDFGLQVNDSIAARVYGVGE